MALAPHWGLPSRPLTYEDLQELPDDGRRYELVDGALLVTPAPNLAHQRCVLHLSALLNSAAPEHLEVFVAPVNWRVNQQTVFQPDVLVVETGAAGTYLSDTPLLIVEVLSPSTAMVDRTTKWASYERAGVPAYWIVDPDGPSLTALRLQNGGYVLDAMVEGDDEYRADFPFPVTVVSSRLLHRYA
jgi:Uma2 family endonuclease